MKIKKIILENYRNLKDLCVQFPENGINIYGFNGVGKTNLLEAIFYFSTGKSFRAKSDSEIINFNKDYFRLSSFIEINNFEYHFEIGYSRNKKKIVKINGRLINKLTDLYGKFKVIFFSPNDIDIVIGSPSNRRIFFDKAIAQLYPEYLVVLNRQRRILKQRNFLLKSNYINSEKLSWDNQFINNSVLLLSYRQNYLKDFNRIFQEKYSGISSNKEQVEISYYVNFKIENSYEQSFRKELLKITSREKIYQRTMIGPQLDDYIIKIDSKNSKLYASQGQMRSIAIALRLTQASILNEKKIFPVLIFDDVIGELDNVRTKSLLNLLNDNHQIFIASPKLENLPKNRINLELK